MDEMTDDDPAAIEAEFVLSWDQMEHYFLILFEQDGWACVQPIYPFIRNLRERGYEQQFRAGQSMWRFILSRSQKHGLSENQASIVFDSCRKGGMSVTFFSNQFEQDTELFVEKVEVTSDIEALLMRLLAEPIN